MSIEKHLSDLTAAVTALTAALNQRAGATTVPQAPAPVAAAPQYAPQTAPAPAPAMPALPTLPQHRPPLLPWRWLHPSPMVPA